MIGLDNATWSSEPDLRRPDTAILAPRNQ